jgi:hypothetical protein
MNPGFGLSIEFDFHLSRRCGLSPPLQGHGDWATARKAMAPSFSTKNLHKQLPVLQSKLDELCQVPLQGFW